ncbi:transposase [Pseudoalteromonas piscicida]|uniref:Transposase n=3 Tax=Pseudoalteromonas piscicida TaxID=43662 RepID=A0AAD0RM51_PSEO7|nr:transposase [Pseudoalteromonas piscicida]AXR03866.1 transposase [Pseudoalteromonas piscicida]
MLMYYADAVVTNHKHHQSNLAGLEYLKQIHKLSDENTVVMWCENPYWQYFCGM